MSAPTCAVRGGDHDLESAEQVQIDPSWMDIDPESVTAFERHSAKAQLVHLVKAADALVEDDWRLGQLIDLLIERLVESAPDESVLALAQTIGRMSTDVGNASFNLRAMTASVALRNGCSQEADLTDEDQQMERTVILGEAAGIFGLLAASKDRRISALASETQQLVLRARQLSEDLVDTAEEQRPMVLQKLGRALESSSAAANAFAEQIDGSQQSSMGVWAAVRLVAGVKREMDSIIPTGVRQVPATATAGAGDVSAAVASAGSPDASRQRSQAQVHAIVDNDVLDAINTDLLDVVTLLRASMNEASDCHGAIDDDKVTDASSRTVSLIAMADEKVRGALRALAL